MHRTAAMIIVAIAAGSTAPTAHAGKVDDRWKSSTTNGITLVTYLDAGKKNTVFSASCNAASHLLTLRYAGEENTPLTADSEPLAINLGGKTVPLRTVFKEDHQEGTVMIDAPTAALFAGTGAVEIAAASKLGGRWYVGQAAPLRALVKSCGK